MNDDQAGAVTGGTVLSSGAANPRSARRASAGLRPEAMSGSRARHVAPSSPMTRTRSGIGLLAGPRCVVRTGRSKRQLVSVLLVELRPEVDLDGRDEPLVTELLDVYGDLAPASRPNFDDGLGVALLLDRLGDGRDLALE